MELDTGEHGGSTGYMSKLPALDSHSQFYCPEDLTVLALSLTSLCGTGKRGSNMRSAEIKIIDLDDYKSLIP